MPMDGRPAATRAIWPDIEKLICAKLDSFSNPESAVEINSSVIPGPRVLVHGPIHPRQPPCPRFLAERYRNGSRGDAETRRGRLMGGARDVWNGAREVPGLTGNHHAQVLGDLRGSA